MAYDSRRLYDGEYVCVMRQGHPLATGELSLDTYCAARRMLVSFSGRPFGFIDEVLASLRRTRRVVITVNQFFTAGRVVVGSDLLTVLPRHFIPVTGIADKLVQRPLPLNVPAVHAWMPCGADAGRRKRPWSGCCIPGPISPQHVS